MIPSNENLEELYKLLTIVMLAHYTFSCLLEYIIVLFCIKIHQILLISFVERANIFWWELVTERLDYKGFAAEVGLKREAYS